MSTKHRADSAQDEADRVLKQMLAMFDKGMTDDEIAEAAPKISDEALRVLLAGKARVRPTLH